MADTGHDEFLATLVHELRAPLNAVLGWTRMLRTGHVPASERDRVLATIEQNAEALSSLVEDYMDVARLAAGKGTMPRRAVDLAGVVGRVAFAARPLAELRGVALEVTLDPAARCVVEGDGARLRQVVENLLSNALKFTPAGGRVTLTLSRPQDEVTLVVADTGAGIANDALPHVFERFWQGQGEDAGATGLGLGLFLVRDIVEMHGGRVRAESAGLGHGATFVVTIPARSATDHPDAEGLPASHVRVRRGIRRTGRNS